MRYHLQEGPDGVIWVSVQPLIQDCREILDNAISLDTSTMTDSEIKGVDFTIMSIKSVIEFLNSLLLEHNTNKSINDENSTRPTTH